LDTIKKPVKTEVQSDGRIRKWKFIEEVGKYLRVILLFMKRSIAEQMHYHRSFSARFCGPPRYRVFFALSVEHSVKLLRYSICSG